MGSVHHEAEPLLSGRDESPTPTSAPDRYRALARSIGCYIPALAIGWHDGCIGALIPYLQPYYGIRDEEASYVFMGAFTGYVLASLLNVALNKRLGLGRLVILGASLQGLASFIVACRPPFIVIAICYSVAGFGNASQDAQLNTYVAGLPGAATKLGILHGMYGLGALSSPIVATLLMQTNIAPPRFYFTNVTWCAVSLTVLLFGFGFSGMGSSAAKSHAEAGDERVESLKTVVSTRPVWATLLFMGFYTGSETTEAGWVVSFLRRARSDGRVSGYASAAYYTGLTSSRIVLIPLTAWLTQKRAVALYVLTALAMQVVVWATPLLAVDFVAVAACGFVMGPVYPTAVSLVTKATPRGYHPGALSMMACCGMFGSAVFPFLVGTLADRHGIWVLQPVLVSLFTLQFLFWQLVPAAKDALYSAPLGSKPPSVNESEDPSFQNREA